MNTFCRVPVGFHFDYLSILGVKSDKTNDKVVYDDYLQCCADLRNQIGAVKFQEILASKEYMDLYDANSYLFDLVDAIKKDKMLGQELDNQVFVRWQKKKALQEKFFPGTEFGEKKFGY